MKLKRLGVLAVSLALAFSLALPAQAVSTFTDVPESYWGYTDIMSMYSRGYAKGYGDGTFKPDGKMTAAETLLFCARATGVNSATQEKISADRKEEMEAIIPTEIQSWANKEMAVAVETGVLSTAELEALARAGALTKTITRENICMYLVRAMQLEPLAKSLTSYPLNYTDAEEISPALRPYIYILTNYGIIKGMNGGRFAPKGAVTRAQMTTMLSRALTFMEEYGITAELSEYTTYSWKGGTITAVTTAADGSTIITLRSEISGAQSYAIPADAKIYKDNMRSTANALKVGQYVRLNMTSRGTVNEVRVSGVLTAFTGTVSSLADGKLSLLVNGSVRSVTIDRFTEVMVGKTAGDRSLIDEEAGYTTALCYEDETGHLAAVKFSGGTQLVAGLVESVDTAVNGTVTLGVTQFNGVVYRYAIPVGAAVTVNGALGSLSSSQVGRYVQVRVNNDTGEAASVAVDTYSKYVQGPVKRTGTVGTSKSFTVTDLFTGKEETHVVSDSAVIIYDGAFKKASDIEKGWYVTALVSADLYTQVSAYPGSVTVEGTLSNIVYDTPTRLSVTLSDDSIVTYDLDPAALPTITRSGKSSSVDKLLIGDAVVITVRYNEVTKIEATPKDANLTGTVSEINMNASGVTLVVELTGGTKVSYSISEGVSVTQNGVATNIYSLKPNQTVGLVTNGDQVMSIDIISSGSTSRQLTGTVYTTNNSGTTRSMVLLVPNTTGGNDTVTVDVKNAKIMAAATGDSVSLNSLSYGDQVIVHGSYDGALFVATIVILQ
ncbi:MAG: S-layer homology domain-containing protein [Clostridiales bacterium]|nr:S-layer homology domain-containing protein [Clostridiales bacterium]